jgi:hypothetical protein
MPRREQPDQRNGLASAELMHPIYLDTPMLISFLATIDDGVYFTSEVAEKVADTRKSGGEGSPR